MDTTGNLGFEFLDLTDVDEYERIRVLSSLQPLQPHVKFPWFIGAEDTNIEGINSIKPPQLQPSVTTNQSSVPAVNKTPILSVADQENGLILPLSNKNDEVVNNPTPIMINTINGPTNTQINSQYYSPTPQYYSPPTVVTTIPNVAVQIPPTYGSYAPNTSHTEIPTNNTMYPYITYAIKQPVFYGVPPAQPIFVSHPSTTNVGSYYHSNTPPYVSNAVPDIKGTHELWKAENPLLHAVAIQDLEQKQTMSPQKPVSPLSADTPAFTPKNQQNLVVEMQENNLKSLEVQNPQPESQNADNIVEKAEEFVPVQASLPPIEGKTTPKQTTAWVGGKSWASLFTPKEETMGSPEVNGLTKPVFPKAVNPESNNNEVACPIKNPKRNHFIDPNSYRMGEFLSNFIVDGRAISLQPRGLINQSNYCYINSILQALIACPPIYNLLNGLAEYISSNVKRKPTPVIDGICKFVKEYKHLPANMRVNNRRSEGGKKDQKKDQGAVINTDIPFEPAWIYKILHGLQTDLMEGRQEDAEEFLGCLLNNLSDEMLELMKLVGTTEKTLIKESEDEEDVWQVMGVKNKGSVLRKTEFERTPITDIFGGSLKSRIQRVGGLNTENTQPFLTLPLNIEKVKTVREALEALTTKNVLEGLTSSKTNEQVEAWQQVMLDELPIVLVLHLKCFDFKLDGCTKILKALEFPIDLKIDPKLLSKTINAKEKQYKLFAVVYHDGKEATKGHYITDAFHVGYSSWLRYDDASVKPVQEEQVLNPQGTRVPYLLFYRRSDTIRR